MTTDSTDKNILTRIPPMNTNLDGVLIWRGARIVFNPQRLDLSDALRVGTTRAPAIGWNFKSGHCPNLKLPELILRRVSAREDGSSPTVIKKRAAPKSSACEEKPKSMPADLALLAAPEQERQTARTGLRFLISPEKIFATDAGLTANSTQRRAINSRMIGHRGRGAGAIISLTNHRDMFTLANNFNSQGPQGSRCPDLGSIHRKFWHGRQVYTTASATKASNAGFSDSKESRPKVSM